MNLCKKISQLTKLGFGELLCIRNKARHRLMRLVKE